MPSSSTRPEYALYRPNTRVNTLAGAILGLLLGGLIVFFVEYREAGVIRSPEDVERVPVALGAGRHSAC